MKRRQILQRQCGSLMVATVFALTACSKSPPAPAPPAAQSTPPPATTEKSTTDLVIDGITGRTALQAGEKARATLEKVKTQSEADMAEAESF